MPTLFELKEKMATLSAAISEDAAWIAEKAATPETPMDELNQKAAHRDELQKRFDMLKSEHDRIEAEQRAAVERQQQEEDDGDVRKARGAFYRAVLTGGDVRGVMKAYSGLGALPAGSADLGSGDRLLPTNMSRELLTEPEEVNSLRRVETVTNITGLEIPKLDYTIDEETVADVTDADTAREIELEGDSIAFGRFKTKVMATVKDTVLHGAAVDIADKVDAALRSALAMKEKLRAFATAPDDAHAHMSFYSQKVGIKKVFGATLLQAILNAYGDLADFYASGAKVVMRRSDYTAMLQSLANSSDTLFGKKPEEIIGIPVEFNDKAVTPIVGNFAYAQQNYDIGAIYDADKDVKKGEYYFVLTTWGDHRIKLKSAFRLAVIGEVPTLTGVTVSSPKAGTPTTLTLTYSSGAPTPNLSYQWQIASSASGSYADIDGATYATYTPTDGDVGKFLKCQVTAAGSATGTQVSAASAAVASAS